MSETVTADAPIVVTVKYGKGYEAPWVVFRGDTSDQVRGRMFDYFGVDSNAYEGLSLHEVVLSLVEVAQGTRALVTNLGAEVVPTNGTGTVPGTTTDTNVRGSAAFDAAIDELGPYASVISLFEAAESRSALTKLYARYKDAYEASEAVREAYKRRGKEVK